MNEFDESTALQAGQPHAWGARSDPQREANTGMFGGWTAAMLLKAVLADAPDAGTPVSLTVHYLKLVPPGQALAIRTRPLAASRAVATWQAELSMDGAPEVAAQATVVLAKRRDSDAFTELTMPDAPPPDGLPAFRPPGPFGQHSLVRPMRGFPPFNHPDTRALFWLRETSGRALDHVQLAYLADNYPPRNWTRLAAPGPYSTLTMSVYFHANAQEMAALGDDDVLVDVVGTRAESSTVGSVARIWSRSGALLLTTEQMGWFR